MDQDPTGGAPIGFGTVVQEFSNIRRNPEFTSRLHDVIEEGGNRSGLNANYKLQKVYLVYVDEETGTYSIEGAYPSSPSMDPDAPASRDDNNPRPSDPLPKDARKAT